MFLFPIRPMQRLVSSEVSFVSTFSTARLESVGKEKTFMELHQSKTFSSGRDNIAPEELQ